MWRACVLPWGRIVARVNCGKEGGKEWEAERDREKERAVPGFIYPQGNCNVLPCHRPINGASLPLCLTLFPLFPSPSVHSSFFFSRFSAILRPSYVISHTRIVPLHGFTVLILDNGECPIPPLRIPYVPIIHRNFVRSSLKRANANSPNEFSRTITIRIYRVAEVIVTARLLTLSLAFERIMSSTRKISQKLFCLVWY